MNSENNWLAQREKKSFLALEDGTVFHGYSVGAETDRVGEIVFNTGMCGYQEIVSDPSYAGQAVVMTYPEIGNYGVNSADMESRTLFLNGLVIHHENVPSNFRAETSLQELLKKNHVPCIAGIDTRALTVKLRSCGTLKGFLHCSSEAMSTDDGVARAREWCGLDGQDYASKVSCEAAYSPDDFQDRFFSPEEARNLPPAEFKVAAYDFGIKWNILRSMRLCGMNVRVFPARTPAGELLKWKPDGIFLSNGPADPAALPYAIEAAKSLIGKIPVMGICLGHQILGIACGGRTYRLKFGHHGCNHPVKNLLFGAVEITSQNHNFAIDDKSLPAQVEVTHLNLNDHTVEGLRHKTEPLFSVQYHPEAAPGPHDAFGLFRQFKELMAR